MSNTVIKNVITIGASAGGIAAVSRLVAGFNATFDAAIFIVIHVSRNSLSDVILHEIQRRTKLICLIPEDGQIIENSTIYLAPADHHMMLAGGNISIKKGAFENHWRPSIDVLFRSAAAAYSNCVTGIILTGLLDDGTSGMSAIKRSGGRSIIQDPAEADFPDMPKSVLSNMEVDYKVSIDEMGYILSDLYSREECNVAHVPDDVKLEAEITLRMSSNVEDLEKLGSFTPFTCPDCGGTLVKVETDEVPRYRCYTGHSYTQKSLEESQIKSLEESLWVAIRMMEERKNLLIAMNTHKEPTKVEMASQIKIHIERLKKMMLDLGNNAEVIN
ncbi:chemotaxis protein CheB [Pedobacter metabolipauper]|uniref:protein-glutamate methylesterase n=1 Tax=Pedobacter metabolipauper TaxID=425513 RepID=A0A4V3D1M6_9SPHI|nr:chemotaxis protein CheB [Pedobacter metabolipauper]TDQ11813.1 two-component system chemotaxis response regulator CheB [Pedobacter metabolipauper]